MARTHASMHVPVPPINLYLIVRAGDHKLSAENDRNKDWCTLRGNDGDADMVPKSSSVFFLVCLLCLSSPAIPAYGYICGI